MGLLDDLLSISTGLGLTIEGEVVLGLASDGLVVTEPDVGFVEEARHLLLDVLNIIDLSGKRIVDINAKDLPVSLSLINKSQGTQNLNLLDLTSLTDGRSNLASIKRIVITLALGVRVDVAGVLPGLGDGTVVPHVTVAVLDVPQLAVLGVLERGGRRLEGERVIFFVFVFVFFWKEVIDSMVMEKNKIKNKKEKKKEKKKKRKKKK